MDHFDGPDWTFPGHDPRLDITDLYVFRAPADPSRCVLVMDVNALAPTLADAFHPDAIYRFNVDTDGDAQADVAYSVVFSPREGDKQVAQLYRAAGEDARSADATGELLIEAAAVSFGREAVVHEVGEYRFFAGIRSEPNFIDLEGLFNDMQFTGTDFSLGKNCFSIVLELPQARLGGDAPIGVWARTTVRQDGRLVPIDRAGRPGTTNGFFQGAQRDDFNAAEPSEDRARFLEVVAAATRSQYGYAEEQAREIAEQLLPDMLPYDPNSDEGFPVSGRRLEDDVADFGIAMMTQGAITSDGVGPHEDFRSTFPYLGDPYDVAPGSTYTMPGPIRTS